MYKTYACKYRSSVKKIVRKYSKNGVFSIPYQTRTGLGYCGFYHDGFQRIREVMLDADTLPDYRRKYDAPNSNASRIKRGVCELCGQKTGDIRMHHVRKMKDLTGNNAWEKLMMKMRRKSIAVCKECHDKIHSLTTYIEDVGKIPSFSIYFVSKYFTQHASPEIFFQKILFFFRYDYC